MKIYLDNTPDGCPCLGDIYSGVVIEKYGNVSNDSYDIETIEIPYALLLSQSCDLRWDYEIRKAVADGSRDNYGNALMSSLLFPLHNFELFVKGEHMQQLGWAMPTQNRSRKKYPSWELLKNNDPRYHYFDFSPETRLVPSVIDFKHWFSMEPPLIVEMRSSGHYFGTLRPLFREHVLQRYANYLSRIGLPDELSNIHQEYLWGSCPHE